MDNLMLSPKSKAAVTTSAPTMNQLASKQSLAPTNTTTTGAAFGGMAGSSAPTISGPNYNVNTSALMTSQQGPGTAPGRMGMGMQPPGGGGGMGMGPQPGVPFGGSGGMGMNFYGGGGGGGAPGMGYGGGMGMRPGFGGQPMMGGYGGGAPMQGMGVQQQQRPF